MTEGSLNIHFSAANFVTNPRFTQVHNSYYGNASLNVFVRVVFSVLVSVESGDEVSDLSHQPAFFVC